MHLMTVHLIDLRSDILRCFITFYFTLTKNNKYVWSLNDPKGKVSIYAFIMNNNFIFVLYCTQGIATQHHRQFSAFSQQVSKETWCLTSTETIRLIRDGEKGGGGKGVWRRGERERLYTYRYTVTTRMIPAIR